MIRFTTAIALLLLSTSPGFSAEGTFSLRHEAEAALQRAVRFFHEEVSMEGTYLWEYSLDLTQREGEGVATSDQGWIQPPGTPSVGSAMLKAFHATGDARYLEMVQRTAHGLVHGQLQSGGWYYHVHFKDSNRKKLAYRLNGKDSARNVTTLDDDTTQAALRFLMQADQALHFRDPKIHEAVHYALNHLLDAQFPNGAWSQGFSAPPAPGKHPVLKAGFPEQWPRQWPDSKQYWLKYTFNDDVLANTIDTLFLAERIYGKDNPEHSFQSLARRCRSAAKKAGEFILLAQMPEPQPAWAQQYDFSMHPSWARKFEPPAITGGESQGILHTLLDLYEQTGESRFLEPIPRALAYFERSRLPDGRLARFYELRSNKPLYFTRDYQLTYHDDNVPTHYSFKTPDQTPRIRRRYEALKAIPPQDLPVKERKKQPALNQTLRDETSRIIKALDNQGRWVERGPLRFHRPKDPDILILRSSTFIRNVELLCRYLEASQTSR